jgi:hypothetical protein
LGRSGDDPRFATPGRPILFLRAATREEGGGAACTLELGRWGIRPDALAAGGFAALKKAGAVPSQVAGQRPLLTEVHRDVLEEAGSAREWLLARPCVLVLSGFSAAGQLDPGTRTTLTSLGPDLPILAAGVFVAGGGDTPAGVAVITEDQPVDGEVLVRPAVLPRSLIPIWLGSHTAAATPAEMALACLAALDPPPDLPDWGMCGCCTPLPELERALQGRTVLH